MSLSFWDDDAFEADVLRAQREYEERCLSGRMGFTSRISARRGAWGLRPGRPT